MYIFTFALQRWHVGSLKICFPDLKKRDGEGESMENKQGKRIADVKST